MKADRTLIIQFHESMTQVHATTTALLAPSASASFSSTSSLKTTATFVYLHPFVYHHQEEVTYPFKVQTTTQKVSMSNDNQVELPRSSDDGSNIRCHPHYEPSKRDDLPHLIQALGRYHTRKINPSLSHQDSDSSGGSNSSSSSSSSSRHDCQSPTGSTGSDQSGSNKFSLAFILSSSESDEEESQSTSDPQAQVSKRNRSVSATSACSSAPSSSTTSGSLSHTFSPTNAGRKRVRTSGPGIEGVQMKKGSKFCIVDGCMSRAKHARRCWKHGGSVKCKVSSCINRAKSKGVCWSHGGGTTCSYQGCDTISVSNGFCWAHGGGKRCVMDNCNKPAYERTQNLCASHFKSSQQKKK